MHLRYLLPLLLLLFIKTSFAQPLTQAQKDSLIKVSCEIAKQDMKFRQSPYSDSVTVAYQHQDSISLMHFSELMTHNDSVTITQLLGIIKRWGYPSEKLFGKGVCDLTTVLIHWNNGFPEWFNDPMIVKMFRKEIQRGNITLNNIDYVYYFFVSHTAHDMDYYYLMNTSRKDYGLRVYTDKQFSREDRIPEPSKH